MIVKESDLYETFGEYHSKMEEKEGEEEEELGIELVEEATQEEWTYEEGGIDWGAMMGVENQEEDGRKEKEEEEKKEKVDYEEETMLSNRETREQLINDLNEGLCFIEERLGELESKEQSTFTAYAPSGRPEILQHFDNPEFLNRVEKKLEEALGVLNTKRIYDLISMKHNPE